MSSFLCYLDIVLLFLLSFVSDFLVLLFLYVRMFIHVFRPSFLCFFIYDVFICLVCLFGYLFWYLSLVLLCYVGISLFIYLVR